jgi:hypothetical protein
MVLKPTAANPTQHDPHGPDDPLKTFVHHCLHVSRDDEMAEQAFGWGCGWPLEGFSAKMLDRAKDDFSSNPQRQIHSSMTHMAQIILSTPLVIIVCKYQEMMRWLSRLDGVAVDHVKDFSLREGEMAFFVMKPTTHIC